MLHLSLHSVTTNHAFLIQFYFEIQVYMLLLTNNALKYYCKGFFLFASLAHFCLTE